MSPTRRVTVDGRWWGQWRQPGYGPWMATNHVWSIIRAAMAETVSVQTPEVSATVCEPTTLEHFATSVGLKFQIIRVKLLQFKYYICCTVYTKLYRDNRDLIRYKSIDI